MADIHAFLDNLKAPIELVHHRVIYYTYLVKALLKSIGVPLDKLKFVTGSSYQLKEDYTMDNFRLCSIATERDAKRAGAEVVKQVDNALLSGLLYPGLQALDEQYLGVDAQFGGVDQRKIFIYAEKMLPMLGYARRAHLMNKMVPGLAGGKMSASDPNSKIDLLDDAKTVKKKIGKAFCSPGDVSSENGILAFVKAVLFPIAELRGESVFNINRPEKYGGPMTYTSYEAVEADFKDQKVRSVRNSLKEKKRLTFKMQPEDLKIGVTDAINQLLDPIRIEFEGNPEFQKIAELAYPPENKTKKPAKPKKESNAPTEDVTVKVDNLKLEQQATD